MTLLTLYSSPLNPVSAAGFTQDSNYPASNMVGTYATSILRPWKSTGGTTLDAIEFDFGVAVVPLAIAFSAANFDQFQVIGETAPNASNYATGNMPVAYDGQGRGKGSFEYPGPTAYRYWKLNVTGAATKRDGDNRFSIGAVYFFVTKTLAARDPIFGPPQFDFGYPQSRIDMDNGAIVRDSIGASYAEVTLGFSGGANDDMELIQRLARAANCWISLDGANTARQWPVRHHEAKVSRRLQAYNREQVQYMLREIVAAL